MKTFPKTKKGQLVQSTFSQHAYEDDHQLDRKDAKFLQKESPQTECSEYPIREGSLAVSPIWNPLISKEVKQAYE